MYHGYHVSYLKPRCNSFLKQRLFWTACMKVINVFIQWLSPRPHESVFVWKRRFSPLVLPTVHPFFGKTGTENTSLKNAPQSGELWKRWLLVYVWTGENRGRFSNTMMSCIALRMLRNGYYCICIVHCFSIFLWTSENVLNTLSNVLIFHYFETLEIEFSNWVRKLWCKINCVWLRGGDSGSQLWCEVQKLEFYWFHFPLIYD